MPFVGLGVGVGRQRFRGGFDADYQAVLNYATTQGYTLPSAGQQIIQNQLVLDLKTAGAWSKLDTFGVFATDGDADFALIDWKRLSDYTAVNSPTFTANEGFTGNGTSSYIDTLSPLEFVGSQFSSVTGNGSFGGWAFSGLTTGANPLCGATASTNTIRGGTADIIMNTGLGSSTLTANLYHLNRNTSQADQFQDGVSVKSEIPPVTARLDTDNFQALRDNSTAYSADTISILFSGNDLSSEALNFYNALDNYISAI